jgi:hypothetical protein
MRRGHWFEFEGDDPEEFVMVHPGWTNDRETLVLSVRETGWFSTSHEVADAVERATLHWGFIGEDEEGNLRVCDAEGRQQGQEDMGPLAEVAQVTFAKLG